MLLLRLIFETIHSYSTQMVVMQCCINLYRLFFFWHLYTFMLENLLIVSRKMK
jgi:hypothetical protein